MPILKVPYISQWDADADFSRDDCVPTCSSMMIGYHGGSVSVNKIAEKTGQGLVDLTEIQTALKSFGYNMIGTSFRTIDDLKKSIDAGIPALCIIHYGDLAARQDTGFAGGHAVLAIGYEEKDGKITTVYTNDPDFWSPRRNEGAAKAYPADQFIKAWQSKADGNNPGNLWYLDAPVPVTGIDLDADMPTEVEDAFNLKSKAWYDKHWTFKDFIKDSIKTHDNLDDAELSLKQQVKANDVLKETLDQDVTKFQAKDKQIELLQKTNSENTVQLIEIGKQIDIANNEKAIAVNNLETVTKSKDAAVLELTQVKNILAGNLKNVSFFYRLKYLFG